MYWFEDFLDFSCDKILQILYFLIIITKPIGGVFREV